MIIGLALIPVVAIEIIGAASSLVLLGDARREGQQRRVWLAALALLICLVGLLIAVFAGSGPLVE